MKTTTPRGSAKDLPLIDLRRREKLLRMVAFGLGLRPFRLNRMPEFDASLPAAIGIPTRSSLAVDLLPAIADDVMAGRIADPDEETGIGGALDGEDDYLDAHALVDWNDAPFAATAWVLQRIPRYPGDTEAPSCAFWVWPKGEDVESVDAKTYGVRINVGRGMTLRRPGIDDPMVERPRLVLPS